MLFLLVLALLLARQDLVRPFIRAGVGLLFSAKGVVYQ